MPYGYDAYDEYLAYVRSAQLLPISAAPTIHPGSAAARLGLTQEEMGEVLEDQEEWMREEEEQEWREEGHTITEETHHHQQGRDNSTDARTAPPPLGYMYNTTYNMTNNNDDAPVTSFKHRNVDYNAVHAEPNHDMTELLTRELVFPRDLEGDWAEDWDEEMGFTIQSEYIQDSYPPAHSPAPWHLPPPPTSEYAPHGPTTDLPATNTPPHAPTSPPDTPAPTPAAAMHPHSAPLSKNAQVT
ncbi:hypothetical protein PILCRDRAFT_91779 [Piloderma croceum F 1598]|uniref:Uncharacterized protein n=1 Tax=Piloderma croceum (strain F 1598) TaxID=765440 RepID=A0A0C3EU34_PILCF|nr:hypothetical protein PILCRDRAFT_91779 [Piloderma croceum F 1598]